MCGRPGGHVPAPEGRGDGVAALVDGRPDGPGLHRAAPARRADQAGRAARAHADAHTLSLYSRSACTSAAAAIRWSTWSPIALARSSASVRSEGDPMPDWRFTRARRRCSSAATASVSDSPVSPRARRDRKSTRLNSSHLGISYAVFCLKKKKKLVIVILSEWDDSALTARAFDVDDGWKLYGTLGEDSQGTQP